MVSWAPFLIIIIIIIIMMMMMMMMMIMVMVMMHNVWYVTEGKQLMKPLKFLSIKQLSCKKRLHNVLIGSKIKA